MYKIKIVIGVLIFLEIVIRSECGECNETNNVSHWSISNITVQTRTFKNQHCVVLKDPITYKTNHGYPSGSEPHILQGRFPQFTCTVKARTDCTNTSAVFLLGVSASCIDLSYAAPSFEVSNKETQICNNSTCQTFVRLNVTHDNSNNTTDHKIVDNMTMNVTFESINSLVLTYQTCMEERLQFQLPISANVPLDVSCTTYNGAPLFDEICLLPESTSPTSETMETTQENTIITGTVNGSTQLTESSTHTSDNQAQSKSLVMIAIVGGVGGWILPPIAIFVYCICSKYRTQQSTTKPQETAETNHRGNTILGDNRTSRFGVENIYEEMNLGTLHVDVISESQSQSTLQQSRESLEICAQLNPDYVDLPVNHQEDGAIRSDAYVAKCSHGDLNVLEETNLDTKLLPLGKDEIESLYAKPVKKKPRMTENDIYESASQLNVDIDGKQLGKSLGDTNV